MHRSNLVKYVQSSYTEGNFKFTYLIDDQELILNLTHNIESKLSQNTIEHIAFNIGMCYLMDISEIMLTKKVIIYKSISSQALNYWKNLYEELVIEKCYALNLPSAYKNIQWTTNSTEYNFTPFTVTGKRNHTAVCLTGGKESLAILKTLDGKKPLLLFFLDPETNAHRRKVFQTVQESHLTVKTISDRKEQFAPLEKTHGGLHSGVDIAHLVFNTMLYADICEYVLIGNEYSSNYPNDIYEGSVVNHQFVKTIHFAENLNNYLHEFLTPDFTYYSPFFGMYEFKIADLLFKDDKYLDVWTSCNQTTAKVNFCSNCYKCAFTYLIARTKKSKEYLSTIFARDMLEDVDIFKPLMDFAGKKPLDCVGDKTEVWVALELLRSQGTKNKVINYFIQNVRPIIAPDIDKYKKHINAIQRVPVTMPPDLEKIIHDALA